MQPPVRYTAIASSDISPEEAAKPQQLPTYHHFMNQYTAQAHLGVIRCIRQQHSSERLQTISGRKPTHARECPSQVLVDV